MELASAAKSYSTPAISDKREGESYFTKYAADIITPRVYNQGIQNDLVERSNFPHNRGMLRRSRCVLIFL